MSSSRLVGRLRVIMGLDDARFQKGLDDAATGMRRVGQNMQRIGATLSARVTAPITAAGAAATAAFVTSANSLADLQRQSDLAGLSAQEFKVAAMTVQDYGIEQDKLADILKDVNDRLGDFRATGAGPMADFFENVAPKVGLTIKSFEGLTSSQALSKFVTALEDANLSQAEMTFYLEAMASDATALIPAFRDGGAEIAATARRVSELGLSIDDDLIGSARQVQKDFRIVSDVLTTQFQQAMLRLAPVMSQLMTASAPLLERMIGVVGRLAEFTTRVGEASPETLGWSIGLTLAAAAIGPFVGGLGLMITGLVSVGGTLAKVATLLAANPIGVAVAAVAGAAVLIYQNWDDVGPWFEGMWKSVRAIFTGFAGFVTGVFTGDIGGAVNGIKLIWTGLQGYYQGLWDSVVGIFKAAWENGIKPVTDALGMTDQILRGWENLKAGFDRILDAIGAAFDALWSRISPVIDAMKWANENWKGLSGMGGGRAGTTAPAGADVIAPPAPLGDMQGGLAGGTAGIRVQGNTDAQAYADGFSEGMGIRSPSRVMAALGSFMSQGLGMGISAGQPAVDAASARIGQSMSDQITPYFRGITRDAENLGDVFDNVKAGFADLMSDMSSRLASSGMSSIMGGIFNSVLGSIDPLAGVLRGAGLNAIPAFARGTPFSPEGLARINERGGEILDLPGGTRIIPHDISKRMASDQAQPSITYAPTYNISATSDASLTRLEQMLAQDRASFEHRVQKVIARPRG